MSTALGLRHLSYLKSDVRLTADGELVCFHDELLDMGVDGITDHPDVLRAVMISRERGPRCGDGRRRTTLRRRSSRCSEARNHGLPGPDGRAIWRLANR